FAITDQGRTWHRLTADPAKAAGDGTYRRSPAPWFYLSLIAVGLMFVPAFKPPKFREEEKASVANMLVADKPLEPGEPDPLEFEKLAKGVSAFLRNVNTKPPMTLAVTGKWGTGKSSLMNLIRADLGKNRFSSVWFNPWHHQQEEELLAALLENIKLQVIPS